MLLLEEPYSPNSIIFFELVRNVCEALNKIHSTCNVDLLNLIIILIKIDLQINSISSPFRGF